MENNQNLNLNISKEKISKLIEEAYNSDPKFFKELSQL